MTLAHAITTGLGQLEYRVVIEGWPLEFVTRGDMAGTLSDGRERVHGLTRKGLRFRERGRLAEAKLELAGFTARIGDIEGRATEAFSKAPSNTAWLAAKVSPTDTAWTLNSTAGMSAGDRYHIATEVIEIVSVDSGTTLTVIRGLWDTTPQTHEPAFEEDLAFPSMSDVPLILMGRRVWVYAHGPTELATSSVGALAYKGVVGDEPRSQTATTWEVLVDPVTRLLDQELGVGTETEFRITGVYYSASAPFYIRFVQENALNVERIGEISLSGRWLTNQAFCDALTAELKTELTAEGFVGGIHAEPVGDVDWKLVNTVEDKDVSTDEGFPIIIVNMISIDGRFTDSVASGITGRIINRGSDEADSFDFEWDSEYPGNRGVPRWARRGSIAVGSSEDSVPRALLGDEATHPSNRVYLSKTWLINVGDVLTAPLGEEGEGEVRLVVQTVNTTSGYVEWDPDTSSIDDPRTAGTEVRRQQGTGELPLDVVSREELVFRKVVRLGTTFTDLAGFRDSLIANSPELANREGVPLLTADDLASWTDDVAAASGGRPFLTRRDYSFSEPVKMEEFLQAEARLAGLFFTIDRDFKLAVRQLRQVALSEGLGSSEEDDPVIVSKSFGSVQFNADGLWNQVEIKTGYDPIEKEYSGRPLTVRDWVSISMFKKRRTLKIEPKVRADPEPHSPEDARGIAEPVLGFFGTRYAVFSIEVSFQSFLLVIGDPIRIVSPHLPHQGLRGLDTLGLVVGREWDLDTGIGKLDVLVHDLPAHGYSPTGRITGQSNVTGNQWDLTLEANRYAPPGETDASFFNAGDKIRIYEVDDAAPTLLEGTVDSVSGNVVRVTFDAAWTPASSTWNLAYRDAPDLTADQRDFMLQADSTLRIDLGSSTIPAREFSA